MISVGMARGAFEYALQYCKSRVVGGKPLVRHSLISARFADMATKIDIQFYADARDALIKAIVE